uniref:chromate transporter n=1 Tax=Candidatus Cryptobacteroides bacterium TaxID=3085639 RepID=UPI0040272D78
MNMSEETLNASKEEVSLWQIFTVFAKIGAFTIGGGYAMIPLIRDEMIKRDWMSDEELPDIIAMAQSAPGVLAVNMSIFVGHKLRGVKGSVVATLGSVIPSFVAILLIAMVFTNFRDNPVVERIFKGIRPVVVSLIAVPMINMARKNNKIWWAWAISAVTLFLVAFLSFSPVYILLVLIVVSAGIAVIRDKKEVRND